MPVRPNGGGGRIGGRSQLAGLTAVIVISVLVAVAGVASSTCRGGAGRCPGVHRVRIFRVEEMVSIARKGDNEIFLVVASPPW